MLPSTNRPRELTSAESTRNFMRPPHQCPQNAKCSKFDAIPKSIKPLMNIMFIVGAMMGILLG